MLSIFAISMMIMCSWGEVMILLSFFFLNFFIMNPTYMSVSSFLLEFDDLSWCLVMLSFWVIKVSIFSSLKIKFLFKFNSMFMIIILSLLISLILSFLVSNLFMFYIMFEACLIPILLLIVGWGYQPERSKAGVYMLFYTLFGSLPLLVVIMYMKMLMGSMYMYMGIKIMPNMLMFSFIVGAFLIKFPMYGLHLWLLKAHVEAPVSGSMILAGVLLKLGGYGLIRLFYLISSFKGLCVEIIISISLWGGIMLSLVCLSYMDMKLLIATSSVVHMGMCICGLFLKSEWGTKGCIGMMLSHGVCSAGLFCLASLVYELTGSRSMLINKGLLNLMPNMSLWWFFLVVSNMAGPPSLNLVSEIMLLISIINWNHLSMLNLMFLGVFSIAYSLYLYSLSQHGIFNKSKGILKSSVVINYLVMMMHWLPLNLLILNINFLFCFN